MCITAYLFCLDFYIRRRTITLSIRGSSFVTFEKMAKSDSSLVCSMASPIHNGLIHRKVKYVAHNLYG